MFIYNWLLKYILTILPAAEPGPLEVRDDGERPRRVLPLPEVLLPLHLLKTGSFLKGKMCLSEILVH